MYRCGSSESGTVRELATENNLDPDTTYAVGVAATDRVGNPGKLSNIICADPEPVSDFFDGYTAAGGKGGGGFCNCALVGATPSVPYGALAWLGAVAALGYRRRRTA
jgi:MYXO-CTERM domain-containing protein